MAGLLQDHWCGAEWSGSPSGHVSVVEDVEPGEGGVHVSVEVGGATELRQPDAVTAGQLQNGDVGRRGPRHAFRPDGRHHLAVLQQHHRRLQYITHRPAAKALVTRATRLQLDRAMRRFEDLRRKTDRLYSSKESRTTVDSNRILQSHEAPNVFRPLYQHGFQQVSTYPAVWSRCAIKRKTQKEVA